MPAGRIHLAAAGILDGQDATTHWAWAAELERRGARYTEQRVVDRGKVITAAGAALTATARAVALMELERPAGLAERRQVPLRNGDARTRIERPIDVATPLFSCHVAVDTPMR